MVSSTPSAGPSSTLPAQASAQISYAVLGKTLAAERQEGSDIVSMIDAAAPPARQALPSGDPLVAKATGLGGLLDTFA